MANVTRAHSFMSETQDHLLKMFNNELVFGEYYCYLLHGVRCKSIVSLSIFIRHYIDILVLICPYVDDTFIILPRLTILCELRKWTISFSFADEVVDSWAFMSTPWSVLSILSVYLLFVLRLGPNMMENRKPYYIKNVLLVYNAIQTLYNGWLVMWVSCTFFFYLTFTVLKKHNDGLI